MKIYVIIGEVAHEFSEPLGAFVNEEDAKQEVARLKKEGTRSLEFGIRYDNFEYHEIDLIGPTDR